MSDLDTNQRYWFVYLIVKRAIHEKMIDKKSILPSWLTTQIKYLRFHTKDIYLFDERIPFGQDKQTDNDLLDCILDLSKIAKPNMYYPGMLLVKDILEINLKSKKEQVLYKMFCRILTAGIKWTANEIKITWFHLKKSVQNTNPTIFWIYIQEVVNLPLDDANTILVPEHIDAEFTHPRIFAHNLLEHWISDETFDVKDPQIVGDWLTTGKPRGIGGVEDPRTEISRIEAKKELHRVLGGTEYYRDKCDHGWLLLAKMGGLKGDRMQRHLRKIDDDIEREAKYDQLVGTNLDFDDMHELTIKSRHYDTDEE